MKHKSNQYSGGCFNVGHSTITINLGNFSLGICC